jgi:hypothetical protein
VKAVTDRLGKLFVLLSQLLNVLLLNGSPDETISGRCYRQGVLLGDKRWKKARNVINVIFFWQDDHCRISHQKDVDFAETINSSR